MSPSMQYTVYRYDRHGKIVQSHAVTSASAIEAFEAARAAVIGERQELLSRACVSATADVEDAA